MKNVYDILVNFKKVAYEFYEWNKNDEIEHIKVIPSFKVSEECLLDFTNCNLIVEKIFLNKIKEKTEIFCSRIIKVIDYSCVIFNDNTSLALEFDEKGNMIGRSKLLFDESDDVISSGAEIKESKINYNILSRMGDKRNYTRKESKVMVILTRYLDKIFEKDEKDEIKYMYFECFNDEEEDINKAYMKLKSHVDNANFDIIDKLRSLIKVLKK